MGSLPSHEILAPTPSPQIFKFPRLLTLMPALSTFVLFTDHFPIYCFIDHHNNTSCDRQEFFFFFFIHIWKFLDQGLNSSCSYDPCHSCSNARSLTHYAGLGIKFVPPQRQCQILNPLHHSRNFREEFFLFCFVFLGLHPWHMEIPRLGSHRSYSLHHSHSNKGSKPHLRPIPQLTAMLDP